MCVYSANHLDRICNVSWNLNGFYGNLTFIWLWDWYVPIIEKYLLQPYTVVTTNAGLNRASYDHITNSVSEVKKQFPNLWNAPIDNTSFLIYRQTTEQVYTQYKSSIDQQNAWIKNYTRLKPLLHHSILELDIPTKGRHHYIDAAHHPGLQTDLHIQFLLNKFCFN
jgi:hypothetical protein